MKLDKLSLQTKVAKSILFTDKTILQQYASQKKLIKNRETKKKQIFSWLGQSVYRSNDIQRAGCRGVACTSEER